MVFHATFNNISIKSCQSVLFVGETGGNHRRVESHWQTLSHNVTFLSDCVAFYKCALNIFHFYALEVPSWSIIIFTTTYAISAYHYYSCEFKSRSWRGVLVTTLCDKVCQYVAVTCRWFSPGTPVSFTNKTTHNDIAVILSKVELNTIID